MKLSEIAEKIEGALEGDGSVDISGVNGIADASAHEISFIANVKYAATASTTGAGAVIVSKDWNQECPVPVIRTENPDAAFAQVAMLFYRPVPAPVPGVHPTAVVAADVVLGEGVSVGPHCVIEPGVSIGANTVISAQCYVGHNVRIGENSKLYSQVSARESAIIGDRTFRSALWKLAMMWRLAPTSPSTAPVLAEHLLVMEQRSIIWFKLLTTW